MTEVAIGRRFKKPKNEIMCMQQYTIASVSKKRPPVASNDLGGCRDQAYHFQHKRLPLYAQSKEPFDTGHGRPYRKTPSVSENGLRGPQNYLGGCRDQAYHFQHQKLPLYGLSREPFHTGHGRPCRTTMQANKQTNSALLYIYRDNAIECSREHGCPQTWRIATVATDTPPNLLLVQGLYRIIGKVWRIIASSLPIGHLTFGMISTVEEPL